MRQSILQSFSKMFLAIICTYRKKEHPLEVPESCFLNICYEVLLNSLELGLKLSPPVNNITEGSFPYRIPFQNNRNNLIPYSVVVTRRFFAVTRSL
jgi:hypothetical protein